MSLILSGVSNNILRFRIVNLIISACCLSRVLKIFENLQIRDFLSRFVKFRDLQIAHVSKNVFVENSPSLTTFVEVRKNFGKKFAIFWQLTFKKITVLSKFMLFEICSLLPLENCFSTASSKLNFHLCFFDFSLHKFVYDEVITLPHSYRKIFNKNNKQ